MALKEFFKIICIKFRYCKPLDKVLWEITDRKLAQGKPIKLHDLKKVFTFRFMNKNENEVTECICKAVNAKASRNEYHSLVDEVRKALARNEQNLTFLWLLDAETLALCGGLFVLGDDIRQISVNKLLKKYNNKKKISNHSDIQKLYAIYLCEGKFESAMDVLNKSGKSWKRRNSALWDIMSASASKKLDLSSKLDQHETSNRQFLESVGGKSIAVIGSASSPLDVDEILRDFDLNVHLANIETELLHEDTRKCGVFISYCTRGKAEISSKYGDLQFFRKLNVSINKKPSNSFQTEFSREGKSRKSHGATAPLMFQGEGTLMQEILMDLFFFSPERIKLFNFNLFLPNTSSKYYQKGYCFEDMQHIDERMIWSYAVNNIISNFELTKIWHTMGCFEVDERLEKVLSLNKREYLSHMEQLVYNRNWHTELQGKISVKKKDSFEKQEEAKESNLFFMLCKNDTDNLVNAIIERYKPEKCVIIVIPPEGGSAEKVQGSSILGALIHADVVHAQYEKYISDSDLPPLDESLLSKMSCYESVILNLLIRNPVKGEVRSYEERVRLYYAHLRYWDYLLDKASIKIAVFNNAPHMGYDFIIYCLCTLKGIAVGMCTPAMNPSYLAFCSDILKPCPSLLEEYERLSSKNKDASIDEIELEPDLLKVFDTLRSDKDRTPYYMNSTSVWKEDNLTKAYDSFSHLADFSRPYIYFPLHFQPELTTCPLGGVYVNQLLAIRLISYYLPEHVLIYVKEHPNQPMRPFGRPLHTYHDLAQISNVVMVSRFTDTYQLIENSIAVASITGTAGFEGLFRGKPFLMFGNHPYMYAPGVFNIRNKNDCYEAINHIFSKGAKHSLRDLKIWLKAVGESDEISLCTINYPKLIEQGLVPITEEENQARIANGYFRVLDRQLKGK